MASLWKKGVHLNLRNVSYFLINMSRDYILISICRFELMHVLYTVCTASQSSLSVPSISLRGNAENGWFPSDITLTSLTMPFFDADC